MRKGWDPTGTTQPLDTVTGVKAESCPVSTPDTLLNLSEGHFRVQARLSRGWATCHGSKRPRDQTDAEAPAWWLLCGDDRLTVCQLMTLNAYMGSHPFKQPSLLRNRAADEMHQLTLTDPCLMTSHSLRRTHGVSKEGRQG